VRSGASRSLVAFWAAMARFRVSNSARSDSLWLMFSGIGTLGRLKAKFASAIEPPTTQAADGIGRPLSLRSFTPAETRIASAPSPMLSPTDRSDGPLFLASGRCAAIGSERSWSVVWSADPDHRGLPAPMGVSRSQLGAEEVGRRSVERVHLHELSKESACRIRGTQGPDRPREPRKRTGACDGWKRTLLWA